MKNVLISDVIKLRTITGSGVMDSKNALIESQGDFNKAIEILRKKGEKIADSRLNKKSLEGIIMTKVNFDASIGVIISVNCETDFVAKNKIFFKFAQFLVDLAIKYDSKFELLEADIDGIKVKDKILDHINMMGEKIEIQVFKKIFAPSVGTYVHLGNKIGAIVGFSHKIQNFRELGKEISMQIVAMNPVSIDENKLDVDIIEKELDIYRYLLRKEGKPEHMIENIARRKLDKFFKEKTLLNQKFINNDKLTVKEYLNSIKKGLKVVNFQRVTL